MKKVLSVFLAILMLFSAVTVVSAEDAVEPDDTVTEVVGDSGEGSAEEAPLLGEYDWLLDLPFWTVGPAFKLAKIALKLVRVFLKVAKIFGFVDKDLEDYIIEAILGLIESAQQGEGTTEVTPDVTEPEDTAGALAA